MRTFRDLLIWQKAMSMVTETYTLTQKIPKDEAFGLTAQVRRSAVSIPSNIAEGFGRFSNRDFLRFLNIATASLFEYQTQIEIAKNIDYINEQEFNNLYKSSRELEAMIKSFARKLIPN